MSFDLFFIIGVIGMSCILFAFLAVQTHRWTHDQRRYDALNLVGAMVLVLYALDARASPFVILNSVWTLYSLRDVLRA